MYSILEDILQWLACPGKKNSGTSGMENNEEYGRQLFSFFNIQ